MAVIFLTYVNIGSYWTYIELAARKAAVADELISQLLVWGSLFSVLGCLLAMVTAVGILSQGIDTPKLIISILSFNLLWIFVDVYQMAFAANADHSGSFASLIPCAQGMGLIVGPNVAASMLSATLGYGDVFLMCKRYNKTM